MIRVTLAFRITYFFWPDGEASAIYFCHAAWMHSEHRGIQY